MGTEQGKEMNSTAYWKHSRGKHRTVEGMAIALVGR